MPQQSQTDSWISWVPTGLVGIVTTHRHQDHWGALAEVRERTGAPVFAHVDDAPESTSLSTIPCAKAI
jgi:glyoxylase-like metal-dependent hydrolase (beta-lactamase superfamily II)